MAGHKAKLAVHVAFVRHVQQAFCSAFQQQGGEVPPALIELIAVAKFAVVDASLVTVTQLRSEVGAFSLLAEAPFSADKLDGFYCAQFAEGDGRILQSKTARDLLKGLMRQRLGLLRLAIPTLFGECLRRLGWLPMAWQLSQNRRWHLLALACELLAVGRKQQSAAWYASEHVYQLAQARGHELIYRTVLAKTGPTPALALYLREAISAASSQI